MSAGHIPGSVNVPYASLLNPETKTFKERAQIEDDFAKMGVDLGLPVAASCGSGKDISHPKTKGRRPQFRLLAKYIHKTVRTDTDRARCDWLLLMIKYWWVKK